MRPSPAQPCSSSCLPWRWRSPPPRQRPWRPPQPARRPGRPAAATRRQPGRGVRAGQPGSTMVQVNKGTGLMAMEAARQGLPSVLHRCMRVTARGASWTQATCGLAWEPPWAGRSSHLGAGCLGGSGCLRGGLRRCLRLGLGALRRRRQRRLQAALLRRQLGDGGLQAGRRTPTSTRDTAGMTSL